MSYWVYFPTNLVNRSNVAPDAASKDSVVKIVIIVKNTIIIVSND